MLTSGFYMIIPQYWAEGRAQHRQKGRQVTLRRFGWSDSSQDEAQNNANQRAAEALQRVLAGEKLLPRDPKVAYNGAVGIPIREEIVSRHHQTIITRNSYGARCLNTPHVFFADIDFQTRPPLLLTLLLLGILILCAAAVGWYADSKLLGVILAVIVLVATQGWMNILYRFIQRGKGSEEVFAHNRLMRFVQQHPAWNLRVYRTPAGLRIMATHQTFNPGDPMVAECFRVLATDPLYVKMCLNQQCFRARVSPKPWRIGIQTHLKPRPGNWPIKPERMPARNAWIVQYEAAASSFSACSYKESIGSGIIHPTVKPVQELHDQLCGAFTQRPIA